MQVNPEDSPPDIYVTWSNPRMTDFENAATRNQIKSNKKNSCLWRYSFEPQSTSVAFIFLNWFNLLSSFSLSLSFFFLFIFLFFCKAMYLRTPGCAPDNANCSRYITNLSRKKFKANYLHYNAKFLCNNANRFEFHVITRFWRNNVNLSRHDTIMLRNNANLFALLREKFVL